ncbi:hypothetical protein [Cohnella nanjingensis]|uniref:Secreted protein n=1 Tax=Cohnella nanjingensis TaxID=1387779 RepID=A0A7X0RM40_9BACL|nr:hypothetical protein [Cohnella nanjingensis]MBB6669965.1 hypothetical protein [Cohnella nanjingensis]
MKNKNGTAVPYRTFGHKLALTALLAAAILVPAGCGSAQDGNDNAASPSASASSSASASPSASPSASAPAESASASPEESPSLLPAKDNPYEVAGVEDPAAFNRMFADVQAAVAANDADKVAEHILFPLNVNNDVETVQVKTKDEFLKQYDTIFNDSVKKALAAQKPEDLFVNDEGIMVGKGEMWFGATADQPQKLGIITVSPAKLD